MQEVVLIFKTRFLVSRKGEYVDRMLVQDVRACVRVCVCLGAGGGGSRTEAGYSEGCMSLHCVSVCDE
jgi:hypothetical protein